MVAVETDPGETIVQDEARGGGLLGEVRLADSVALELLEIEAMFFQHLDRPVILILCLKVPLEVELPG